MVIKYYPAKYTKSPTIYYLCPKKPIEIQVSTTRQIPLEQNKEVQTKIKEIIYNNLYDTLIDELKDTISRFQAQYNIQEINPYLQDILQNPEDLVSLSQHHKR